MTPLPGPVDLALMKKEKKALTFLDPDYDQWLHSNHPRILYHHPHLTGQQILHHVDRSWKDFYSVPAVLKRGGRFGFCCEPGKLLTYLVICQGLLTRYKRYGLSAESAVRSRSRRLGDLPGRIALSLMKRKAQLQ